MDEPTVFGVFVSCLEQVNVEIKVFQYSDDIINLSIGSPFLGVSREAAREVSSLLASFWYFVDVVRSE